MNYTTSMDLSASMHDSSLDETRLGQLELPPSPEVVNATVADAALDYEYGLKRALDNNKPPMTPPRKRQKKESWAFKEPAMFVKPPIFSNEKVANPLESLKGDVRRMEIAKMLDHAANLAQTIGQIDPEPDVQPTGGHRRFQRRNSFVIHRNRGDGMFPSLDQASISSNDKLFSSSKEEKGFLGLTRHESTLVFRRRMSLPWNQSMDASNQSNSGANSRAA